tara:strand:- start:45 stop:836 length:792 start_codon:yes stop_codon:yes gene_type:complete
MSMVDTALQQAYPSAVTAQAIRTTIENESGSRLVEGTNYTLNGAIGMLGGNDANRIARIRALYNGRRRLNPQEQQTLFDIAYGGRMGNNGEGHKYRGRGLIQITGRNNYSAVGEALGIGDALVQNPELLLENPSIMLAATDAYLTGVKGMDRSVVLTANTLKDLIGHSGDKPRGFNGTGRAYEGMTRWAEVVEALEAADKPDEAEEARLNDEFSAQQTVGAYIDGDIGANSIRSMRSWLNQRSVPTPENATGLELVRLVNGTN